MNKWQTQNKYKIQFLFAEKGIRPFRHLIVRERTEVKHYNFLDSCSSCHQISWFLQLDVENRPILVSCKRKTILFLLCACHMWMWTWFSSTYEYMYSIFDLYKYKSHEIYRRLFNSCIYYVIYIESLVKWLSMVYVCIRNMTLARIKISDIITIIIFFLPSPSLFIWFQCIFQCAVIINDMKQRSNGKVTYIDGWKSVVIKIVLSMSTWWT